MAPVNGRLREHDWIQIQHKAFLRWINIQLQASHDARVLKHRVLNLQRDLSDGVVLNLVVKEVSKGAYDRPFATKPKFRINYIDNISCVLSYLKDANIQLHNIGAGDIYEGNLKLILGLIWALILHFTLANLHDTRGTDYASIRKILLLWCQRSVQQFDGIVKITDFSASWNNGTAICGLLGSLRPDLLDFYTLDFTRKEANTKKAIALATEIGIPQLVDFEDLLVPRPDEKVVITYLVGWYEKFSDTLILQLEPKVSAKAALRSKLPLPSQAKPTIESQTDGKTSLSHDTNAITTTAPPTATAPTATAPTATAPAAAAPVRRSLAVELKDKVAKAKNLKKQKSILLLARPLFSSSKSSDSLSENSYTSRDTSDGDPELSTTTRVNSVILQFENQASTEGADRAKRISKTLSNSANRLSDFKQRWLSSLAPHLDQFRRNEKKHDNSQPKAKHEVDSLQNELPKDSSQRQNELSKSFDSLSFFSFEPSNGNVSSSQPTTGTAFKKHLTFSVRKEDSPMSVFPDAVLSSSTSDQTSKKQDLIPRRNAKRGRRRPAPMVELSPSFEDSSAIHGSYEIIDSSLDITGGTIANQGRRAGAFVDSSFDGVDNYCDDLDEGLSQADEYSSSDSSNEIMEPAPRNHQAREMKNAEIQKLNVEFRSFMLCLSTIFGLKDEYERKAKVFSSNVRTQIYKWTNLVSYNELYDLDELEYEKKYLENTFQNTKRSLLSAKHGIILIYSKINFLLKSLDPKCHYSPPVGSSLTDLEANWKKLCQEEINYTNIVNLKSEILKANLLDNYLDILHTVNKKAFETKYQVDKFLIKGTESPGQKHEKGLLLAQINKLSALVLNMDDIHQQCVRYSIDIKKSLLDARVSAPCSPLDSEAHYDNDSFLETEFMNPFGPIESLDQKNDGILGSNSSNDKKFIERNILGYEELLFEIELMQESIAVFAKFSQENEHLELRSLGVVDYSADKLSQMFAKTAKHKEYITKKEFRSVICSDKAFDKLFSKAIESCLPTHSSRQGYDHNEFLSNIYQFVPTTKINAQLSGQLLDSPEIIKQPPESIESLSRASWICNQTSRVNSVGSTSPISSPESTTGPPYSSINDTPATIYESDEEVHVRIPLEGMVLKSGVPTNNNEPSNRDLFNAAPKPQQPKKVLRTRKDLKFPSKFQVPMNFTIVLEEQFSV